MSRRVELISPEGTRFIILKLFLNYFLSGLRLDGRRAHELRSVNAAMGVISGRLSEGSSSFEIGNTRVMATVFGPREISSDSDNSRNFNMKSPLTISDADGNDKGSISVKIHAASFSSTGGERRKNTRQDR